MQKNNEDTLDGIPMCRCSGSKPFPQTSAFSGRGLLLNWPPGVAWFSPEHRWHVAFQRIEEKLEHIKISYPWTHTCFINRCVLLVRARSIFIHTELTGRQLNDGRQGCLIVGLIWGQEQCVCVRTHAHTNLKTYKLSLQWEHLRIPL